MVSFPIAPGVDGVMTRITTLHRPLLPRVPSEEARVINHFAFQEKGGSSRYFDGREFVDAGQGLLEKHSTAGFAPAAPIFTKLQALPVGHLAAEYRTQRGGI